MAATDVARSEWTLSLTSVVRVGTDIQSIDSVATSISTFGERYLSALFTAQEIASAGGPDATAAAGLAARFAAKEAVMKVLRPSALPPPWTSIEIVSLPAGWTEVALHGDALELAGASGLNSFSVSLSHDGGFAIAVVTAMQSADRPAR